MTLTLTLTLSVGVTVEDTVRSTIKIHSEGAINGKRSSSPRPSGITGFRTQNESDVVPDVVKYHCNVEVSLFSCVGVVVVVVAFDDGGVLRFVSLEGDNPDTKISGVFFLVLTYISRAHTSLPSGEIKHILDRGCFAEQDDAR